MKLIKKICAAFVVMSTLLASTSVSAYAALPVEKLSVSKTANHIIPVFRRSTMKFPTF